MAPETIQALIDVDMPLLESLSIVFQEATEDSVTLSMTVKDHMINSQGFCHGGYLFSLADTASAYLCALRNVAPVTTESSISYISPAKVNDALIATASFLEVTDKALFCSVRVTNSTSGNTLALYRGTQINKGLIL